MQSMSLTRKTLAIFSLLKITLLRKLINKIIELGQTDSGIQDMTFDAKI